MTWTPEMIYGTIGATGTALVALAGVLNKFKVIRIPFRHSNSNRFSGMSIQEIEACAHKHEMVDAHLSDIDKASSEQKSDIKHMEKRLDKSDEKFDAIQQKLEVINGNIILQGAKYEMREKDLTMTLTNATDVLKKALKKLG